MRLDAPLPASTVWTVALVVLLVLGVRIVEGSRAPTAPPARKAVGLAGAGARFRLDPDAARQTGARPLDAAARAGTFASAPALADADRRMLLQAVEAAQRDARRLIALVDGLVTLDVGPVGERAVGVTTDRGTGWEVRVDLARVWAAGGSRAVSTVMLHELGHVVDQALVPDELAGRLDAEIPRGWGCDGEPTSACAPAPERFADTFAKWATGDIGAHATVGYEVMPPRVPLSEWGAPLAALAA